MNIENGKYSMSDFNRLFEWNQFAEYVDEDQYLDLWNVMRMAYWQLNVAKDMRDSDAKRARMRALKAAKEWGLANVRRIDGVGFPRIIASRTEYDRYLDDLRRAELLRRNTPNAS